MLLALLALAGAPPVPTPVAARCLLVVEGRTIFSGTCDYEPSGRDGSFTIAERTRKGVAPYFAYLVRDPDKSANGYWNETRDSTHADAFLGEMTRHGACWVNGDNRICAWRLR